MNELWQKTSKLFWQFPRLWMPVLAADLIGFCIMQLQRQLSHRIVLWIVERHHSSVLTSATDPVTGRIELIAALLTGPLLWGTYFLRILLYTVAFLITAHLVQSLIVTEEDEQPQVSWQWPRRRSVAGFALKLLVLYGATSALGVWALSLTGRAFLTTPIAVWIFAFVVSAVIVYLMTPSGLALLHTSEIRVNFPRKLELARICGLLSVLALTVIGIFCDQAVRSIARQGDYGVSLWIQAVASLLLALPYSPLFIALAVIAFRGEAPTEVS